MPNEQKLKKLVDRELRSIEITLAAKAARTAITIDEYIELQLNQGIDKEVLLKALEEDLLNGGRIFGEFRNAVRATANGSINRFRDAGEMAELDVEEGSKFRWAAVFVNTCPDCEARHGEVKTWEEWEEEGLPRSGQTVCREHCKCMLIPASMPAMEPIKREKR